MPRKYSYMRKQPAPTQSSPPTPAQIGPWVNLLQAEPTVGQRVVVSFVDEKNNRLYALGKWAVTPFAPGIDRWMSVPNAK